MLTVHLAALLKRRRRWLLSLHWERRNIVHERVLLRGVPVILQLAHADAHVAERQHLQGLGLGLG